ncbi:bifunctional diaminohydroxyphosphoribosylaminopyrimidine deaminase/5-amino-6-(5-phosphoribosylamino)uracil reductase RibD [Fervidobacterium islandicum]|uniref:bifunctional diaminohydroxyphosphoribosylaminopyrimidine deaminase/5-amino-6-(5-phosphoribosylamino)uracil reductase RibD n=1 Tax=Fervidobacterium islandicum TaxID=2423 RepID=UPI003A7675FF
MRAKKLQDEYFMKLAINLAKKGLGRVNPNPPVGAVIVKDGEIIGKGYHKRYGGRHAEREALFDAKRKGHSTLGATLYVTLEPCDHYGKTPPCTDAIIESGIKRVVIGTLDPNPVSGNGLEKLKKNGIDVEIGILEKDVKELTKFFLKYITTGLPYVTLKYAATLDGMIADEDGNSKWITTELRKEVHKLRKTHSAILVGANTVIKDDPLLNVRFESSKTQLKHPKVVVLDKEGVTLNNPSFNIFRPEFSREVFVFTNTAKTNSTLALDHVRILNETEPTKVLQILGKMGVDSVLVEGGASIFSQFLQFSDEIYAFYATKTFGVGKSVFQNLSRKIEHSDINFSITSVKVSKSKRELMVVMKRCSPE